MLQAAARVERQWCHNRYLSQSATASGSIMESTLQVGLTFDRLLEIIVSLFEEQPEEAPLRLTPRRKHPDR